MTKPQVQVEALDIHLPGGLGEAIIITEHKPESEGVTNHYVTLSQTVWLLTSKRKIIWVWQFRLTSLV